MGSNIEKQLKEKVKQFENREERKRFFEMKNGKNNRHGGRDFHKFGDKKFGNRNSGFLRSRNSSQDERVSKDRIAKRLSMLGVASRREAEKMILDGKVKINGIECRDLTFLVSYDDTIAVNGKDVKNKPIKTQIYLMNKPTGYVTSTNDPQGRKTIFELIPAKFGKLMAIGRLDFNTAGLLLLTNNGEVARIMEMPATGLKRVYFAKVIGEINDEIKQKLTSLKHGIKIEGVEYGSMFVNVEDYSSDRATLKIVIFEGKNNEIRRIMWHLGLKVVKLTRIQYGDYRLSGLPSGCVKESPFLPDMKFLSKKASANAKRYTLRKAKEEDKGKKKQEKNDKNIDNNNDDIDESDVVTNDEAVNDVKKEKDNKQKTKDLENNVVDNRSVSQEIVDEVKDNSKNIEKNEEQEEIAINIAESVVKTDEKSTEEKQTEQITEMAVEKNDNKAVGNQQDEPNEDKSNNEADVEKVSQIEETTEEK